VTIVRAALAAALLLSVPFAIAAQDPPPASAAEPFRLSGQIVQGGLVYGVVPNDTVRLTLNGQPIAFDPGGSFLIGFDRDQGPAALLVAELRDGSTLRQMLSVARRAWQIERINQDRPTTGPTPEYAKLREGELIRITAARAMESKTEGWKQRFRLPAKGRISGAFGSQRIYRGGVPAAFHSGLDIAPGAGQPVVAPADGIVVLAGPPMFSLEGNLVIIDHGMGLNSAFLHLASYSVKVGDKVTQGQQFGTVGATGRATGPHVHWSVKWRDARLDPILLVRG
jgi:murein DD-endopeptidase MepM/ murein hydrolase activator NlpD